jgi:hypothetical protein
MTRVDRRGRLCRIQTQRTREESHTLICRLLHSTHPFLLFRCPRRCMAGVRVCVVSGGICWIDVSVSGCSEPLRSENSPRLSSRNHFAPSRSAYNWRRDNRGNVCKQVKFTGNTNDFKNRGKSSRKSPQPSLKWAREGLFVDTIIRVRVRRVRTPLASASN